MKEIFSSKVFLIISSVFLLVLGLYREWEEDRLFKEMKRIFRERRLEKGKTFSIRRLDIFIYYTIQRLFNYFFRGFVTRQVLNQYIIFPLTIIISIYLILNGKELYNIILFVTFMAILWYSKETFALREEQKKSNEIAIGRPLIIIVKEIGDYIGIKNYGNNIAKHISIRFIHRGIQLKDIKYNALSHTQDLIKYPIEKEISHIIDSVDKNFFVEVRYYNFQSLRKHITIFELDDSILFDSRVGRFKIKEDK